MRNEDRNGASGEVGGASFIDVVLVLLVAVFLLIATEPDSVLDASRRDRASGERCCLESPRIVVTESGFVRPVASDLSVDRYLRTVLRRGDCSAGSVVVDLDPRSSAADLVATLQLIRSIDADVDVSVARLALPAT